MFLLKRLPWILSKISSHISMCALDDAITLGEYPTTIQTSRKKADISADLLLLES
jgi:hypothetical protein